MRGGHRHGTKGGTEPVTMRLPREYVAQLDAECAATGKDRSDIMRERLGIMVGADKQDGTP